MLQVSWNLLHTRTRSGVCCGVCKHLFIRLSPQLLDFSFRLDEAAHLDYERAHIALEPLAVGAVELGRQAVARREPRERSREAIPPRLAAQLGVLRQKGLRVLREALRVAHDECQQRIGADVQPRIR